MTRQNENLYSCIVCLFEELSATKSIIIIDNR